VSPQDDTNMLVISSISSVQFLELIEPVTGKKTAIDFQRLIFVEPYAPTSHKDLTETDVKYIGAMTGHNCLRFLDKKLASQSLSSCSGEEARVLFYLILTMLASISHEPRPALFGADGCFLSVVGNHSPGMSLIG
jgi:hypothetical protein